MNEYMIYDFHLGDEEDQLGFFIVRPVDSRKKQLYRMNFHKAGMIFWDHQLLSYVIDVDDADLKPYYPDVDTAKE